MIHGDVLPCPFIHVSFGNVRNALLSDIVTKMRRVPQFGTYPDICVAAEDCYFHDEVFPAIEKYQKGTGPVPCEDVFKSVYSGEKDA